MNIATIASQRKNAKAFDSSKKIPAAKMDELRTLLQVTPSSANVQPWHFIVAATSEGKERIAKATHGTHPSNTAKIVHASHVVVLCGRVDLSDAYLNTLIDKEFADGRMRTPEEKAQLHNMRTHYVNLHKNEAKDVEPWACHQVYIALGVLLLGAAALEVDACPMEGFDPNKLDEEFGLAKQGLKSLALVALGYRSDEDFNAKLPKSRLPMEMLFTEV